MTISLRFGAGFLGALLFLALLTPTPGGAVPTPPPLTVTFQNPVDGAVLSEPPFVFQMCFSRPINIKDLDKGGDFEFNLSTPAKAGIGMRIVFQIDGWGYSIYPGSPPSLGVQPPDQRDHWLFEWHVVAADDGAPSDGQVKFTVDPAADPIPSETPPVCLPGGGTATPVPIFSTPTPTTDPATTATEQPTEPASGEPSPTETDDPGEGGTEEDGDGPDIGPLAFGTIAVAGGLAIVGLVMYFIRRRVGYDPHGPTPDSEHSGEGGDHH